MLPVAVVVPANQTAARPQRLIPLCQESSPFTSQTCGVHFVGLPGMGDVESATSPRVPGVF
jgi:hypothetical protein